MYEEERKALEQAHAADTSKDKKIEELEARLAEMDFLLDEADKYEQEKSQTQQKLQEIVQYEQMVEEMCEEINNKDEELEELANKLNEAQEEERLMEELNNGLETYNKELAAEIEEKDQKI